MKNILKLITPLLAILVLFTACSKEKTKEFIENSGVYNFVKNDNYAIIKKYISDHLPIFSEYSTENDLD